MNICDLQHCQTAMNASTVELQSLIDKDKNDHVVLTTFKHVINATLSVNVLARNDQ